MDMAINFYLGGPIDCPPEIHAGISQGEVMELIEVVCEKLGVGYCIFLPDRPYKLNGPPTSVQVSNYIAEINRAAVLEADIVILNFTNPSRLSIGTPIELLISSAEYLQNFEHKIISNIALVVPGSVSVYANVYADIKATADTLPEYLYELVSQLRDATSINSNGADDGYADAGSLLPDEPE